MRPWAWIEEAGRAGGPHARPGYQQFTSYLGDFGLGGRGGLGLQCMWFQSNNLVIGVQLIDTMSAGAVVACAHAPVSGMQSKDTMCAVSRTPPARVSGWGERA